MEVHQLAALAWDKLIWILCSVNKMVVPHAMPAVHPSSTENGANDIIMRRNRRSAMLSTFISPCRIVDSLNEFRGAKICNFDNFAESKVNN